MSRDLDDRFERLIDFLKSDEWRRLRAEPMLRDEIDWWLDGLEHWLRDGYRWPLRRQFSYPNVARLRDIEAKLDELLSRPTGCNLSRESAQQFPSFMTSLTAINDGNLAVARTKFRSHQSKWLADAVRCVVVDPYVFHPASETPADYVAGLVEIIGPHADRVDFYFSAATDRYKPAVAAGVHAGLVASYKGSKVRRFAYYDCRDMHDRVWLQHTSCVDDPPYVGWSARVVGSSVNGVRKRPTYVVDMEQDDANDYAKYLKNVRDSLAPAAISVVPPP